MSIRPTFSTWLRFTTLASAIAFAPACGKSDSDEEGTLKPGEACSPDDEDLKNGGCSEGLSCAVASHTGISSEEDAEAICLTDAGGECDPTAAYCGDDLTCAETTEGENRCFGRVVLRGIVSDTKDAGPIESAHIIALDEEGSASTDVALSDADGAYLLDIPVVRDADGVPVDSIFTLSASAQDYQPFPQGSRVALPISTSDATAEDKLYVVESALTDIGLIRLPDGERFVASGEVAGLTDESAIGGLLVVAAGDAGTFTALTDKSGQFTLFNLPDGDYEVSSYGAGIQVGSTTLTVNSEDVKDVSLEELESETTTVSGNIQLVNPGDGEATSVILVVADTFNETAARGEVPRGLRAPASGPVDVTGNFTIEGVPEGEYVVLAAYENDALVRDPDTNISGTSFVTLTVSGESELNVEESFKVTGALAVIFPGAEEPEAVTEAPTLEWEDDSSEDWYEVRVYDAFGAEVWSALDVPGVSGSGTVTVDYDGPLEDGMYYQFRVSSWRQPGNGEAAPISTTEDLKGVFYKDVQ